MGNLWNFGEEKSSDPVWAATAWFMTRGRSWGSSARMAAEHMPGAVEEFLKARANMLQDNQPMARRDHLSRTMLREMQNVGQDDWGENLCSGHASRLLKPKCERRYCT